MKILPHAVGRKVTTATTNVTSVMTLGNEYQVCLPTK